MLGRSAGIGHIAKATTGLSRQAIYRIKGDLVGAGAALAGWAVR
jgi:putative DNA-invertase from lambdoid prophage Rac